MRVEIGPIAVNNEPGIALGIVLGTNTISLMLLVVMINIAFGDKPELVKQEDDIDQ